MTIEDLNHWIQFYSIYIMRDTDGEPAILNGLQRNLLTLLQRICGHFLSYSVLGDDPLAAGNPFNESVRRQAAEDCREYARLVEEVSQRQACPGIYQSSIGGHDILLLVLMSCLCSICRSTSSHTTCT